MITETIFAGRNNTFSLQLVRGGEAINLLSITGYTLYLTEDKSFSGDAQDNDPIFKEKEDGVVEISIGHLLTEDDTGKYTAYLVTVDPVNGEGVRWPNFKLKVV